MTSQQKIVKKKKKEKTKSKKEGNDQMQNGDIAETSTAAPLFQTIGKGAEEVDNLADGEKETQKPVEEIESMCIHCEENVASVVK